MDHIDVIVEKGILKPLSPLALKEQEQVRLAIVAAGSDEQSLRACSASAWRWCADPLVMVHLVRHTATPNQLRLFAVACCRVLGLGSGNERLSHALDVAEAFAHDHASTEELQIAHNDVKAYSEEFYA